MRVFFCAVERKMLRSKKSVRGFSGGAGESAVTKKRGQRGKRLIERNFLTTEEKKKNSPFCIESFILNKKFSKNLR
ncbi:hypothetical protein [Gemmiger formicilis]|uniref:hypothetical protein n=1 Tax=Gemmiger formicilis TaxID=745368 RepID=UPI0022E0A92B|nr:hypothetical protein [Gemmiger formicilis]